MAKTFPLLEETYSKQKISIFQHFLTTMFCKKKLPRMLVPQNVEKGLPCAFFQVAVLLCLLYVPPLPSPFIEVKTTLHSLSSVCKFSLLISTDFLWYQEPLEFTIITFILMALTFDSGVILLGEKRCPSLFGKKI